MKALLLRLLAWMTRPRSPFREGAVVYKVGGGWGNAINVMEDWRVVGWKDRIPWVGDELRVPMRSGKTMRCVFVKVDRCVDPTDMFFADIAPVEYVKEASELGQVSPGSGGRGGYVEDTGHE